jgi:hypothetical protein
MISSFSNQSHFNDWNSGGNPTPNGMNHLRAVVKFMFTNALVIDTVVIISMLSFSVYPTSGLKAFGRFLSDVSF